MKNLYSKAIILLIVLVGFAGTNSFANHIPGANITYTCNPGNPLEYTFTFTIFRLCPGTHPTTMTAGNFTLTNTCGLANPVVPTFNQVGVAEDVNQLCASATSNCSGGTDPGVWKYTYEATLVLPANCDSWNLAFELCCRDASSNLTGAAANDMACSTTMNTLTAPCNSSPVVTAQPIPYACTNTNVNYCLTIADPEGDSTYFEMVAPAGNAQAPIAHLGGFTPATPLNNFVLDPLTGCMSFNHPNIGNYVVAVRITSYDNNGDLIASIIHDFQVYVIACNNTPPTNPTGGITNVSGTGTQTGPNTIAACYGDNICFDVIFQDLVDGGNSITIQQDGTALLPGATFTQTGTNPVTGTFCWLSQPGYTGNVVTFIAEDDGCPVMGTSGFAVNFNITTGVFASTDVTICGTQGAVLQGSGSGTYSWSPALGLSNPNIQAPTATPAVTTVYTLTGNLTGSCANTDQVTVHVVPNFNHWMAPNNAANPTICANEIIQLSTVTPQAAHGPYSYSWSPSATLNDDTLINPFANPLTTTNYTVTATSAAGCVQERNVTVTVSGIGPTLTVTPSDTDICAGESVPLITTAFVYPLTCGISSGCSGSTTSAKIGTGTSSTSTYSPYYGSTSTTTNYKSKMQYIYTAAELNALGYYGGTIERLDLFCTSTNAYRYDQVKIRMGCTSQSEYTNTTFIPSASLTEVYSANNVNPTDNNWHNLNITDWDWDGTSNIVVQFCAQEDGSNDEGTNSIRYHTTTPAYRCMYEYSSTVNSCNEVTGSRTTNRPDIRFRICSETPPAPTYSWTTTAGLNNATSATPTATPGTTTSYVLDVTSAGCTGSVIAQVNVSPDYTLSPSASNASICYGTSVSLLGNPSGAVSSTDWSPTGAFGTPTATNPTVTPTGPTTYYINTSNGFCNKLDSITINVAGTPVGARTSKDTVCAGETVNLSTLSASATCGINYSNCTGASTTAVSATGTAASGTYGPFYGSTAAAVYSAKRQYIYNAAELTAMGFTAGMITLLEMDVTTTTGRSYENMDIWMGCTAQDNYPTTTFIPTAALSQVYSVAKYTTTTGWNAFNITGYDWDGTSNIVIQFCSSNPDRTGTESVRYTSTTPVYKMLYYSSSSIASCGNLTGTRNYNRPNMRFTFCSSSFGAGSTYSWSPATVSNPSNSNTTTSVGANQTYTVTVTDPANTACPTTGTVNIYIDTTNTVRASNDTTHCFGDPAVNLGAQFMINGTPSAAGTGLPCYDQTITYTNPALQNGVNNYTFNAVPAAATSGTLTVTAYGDLDGAAEFWTIQDENANTIGTAGGSLTQCGTTHIVAIPLSAAQVVAWIANGSIDFAGVDVGGQVNATLCAVGADLLGLRLQLECPAPGSGYTWTPTTGLSNPNIQNPTVTPTADITYVVKAVGATCDSYDTVRVVMCSTLPVEMISFDVMCKEERILLNWSTASEVNNSRFTIEKSADALNFTPIGSVEGSGNSSTTVNYSFTDSEPFNGTAYYRLKQTDFDGAFEYHGIKPVSCGKETKISIYPNPFENSFTVQLSENSTYPLTIEIYDYLGRTIYSQTLESNLTIITTDELSKGTYFVKVFNENTQIIERITKMK
tara:strand:+ start:2980 stop:7758 length:4779 start_codon:yes stop_codon:yes gene_type:complete